VLEHLATFTVSPENDLVYPADGMRRLLAMEKTNGIWTQKMLMKVERNMINIMDHENKVQIYIHTITCSNKYFYIGQTSDAWMMATYMMYLAHWRHLFTVHRWLHLIDNRSRKRFFCGGGGMLQFFSV
jgi:hypothetical protein